MDQMLSYSNVNHASTNLPFTIIPPFPSSPGSIHTKGHTKRGIFHLPCPTCKSRTCRPSGLLRATLETGLMQTRAFGQKFLKAEALILMDDTVFPQDFVG